MTDETTTAGDRAAVNAMPDLKRANEAWAEARERHRAAWKRWLHATIGAGATYLIVIAATAFTRWAVLGVAISAWLAWRAGQASRERDATLEAWAEARGRAKERHDWYAHIIATLNARDATRTPEASNE